MATNILQNIFTCVQQVKGFHKGLQQFEVEYMMTKCTFLGELSL